MNSHRIIYHKVHKTNSYEKKVVKIVLTLTLEKLVKSEISCDVNDRIAQTLL